MEATVLSRKSACYPNKSNQIFRMMNNNSLDIESEITECGDMVLPPYEYADVNPDQVFAKNDPICNFKYDHKSFSRNIAVMEAIQIKWPNDMKWDVSNLFKSSSRDHKRMVEFRWRVISCLFPINIYPNFWGNDRLVDENGVEIPVPFLKVDLISSNFMNISGKLFRYEKKEDSNEYEMVEHGERIFTSIKLLYQTIYTYLHPKHQQSISDTYKGIFPKELKFLFVHIPNVNHEEISLEELIPQYLINQYRYRRDIGDIIFNFSPFYTANKLRPQEQNMAPFYGEDEDSDDDDFSKEEVLESGDECTSVKSSDDILPDVSKQIFPRARSKKKHQVVDSKLLNQTEHMFKKILKENRNENSHKKNNNEPIMLRPTKRKKVASIALSDDEMIAEIQAKLPSLCSSDIKWIYCGLQVTETINGKPPPKPKRKRK